MGTKAPKLRKGPDGLEVVTSEQPFEVVERVDVEALRKWRQAGELLRLINPPAYEQLVAAMAEYAAITNPTPDDDARYGARLKAIADGIGGVPNTSA